MLFQAIRQLGAGDAEKPSGAAEIAIVAIDSCLQQLLLQHIQLDMTVENAVDKLLRRVIGAYRPHWVIP